MLSSLLTKTIPVQHNCLFIEYARPKTQNVSKVLDEFVNVSSRRSAYGGSPTLSLQVGFQHLAPVSRYSPNAHTHHSAQVSLCSLDADYLSVTLENSFLCFALCLAEMPLCSMRQNLDPTLDFPGLMKHPNIKRRFVLRSVGLLKPFHIVGPRDRFCVTFASRPGCFFSCASRSSWFEHFPVFTNKVSFGLHSRWVNLLFTWSRNVVGSPRPTSFINFFHMKAMFWFLRTILMSSTFTERTIRVFDEQTDIPNSDFSHPSPRRTFPNCLSHKRPASACPYKFRLKNPGIYDVWHDLRHFCRGRRVHISGQSDVVIFSNFGAPSIYTWVFADTASAACLVQSSSLAMTSITLAAVIWDADEPCSVNTALSINETKWFFLFVLPEWPLSCLHLGQLPRWQLFELLPSFVHWSFRICICHRLAHLNKFVHQFVLTYWIEPFLRDMIFKILW